MKSRVLAWMMVVVTWTLVGQQLVLAHDASTHYDNGPTSGLEIWPSDPDVQFTNEPNQAKKDEIEAGFDNWNNQPNSTFDFRFPGGEVNNYPFWERADDQNFCADPKPHGIHWDDSIPNSTGFIAYTVWCWNNNGAITDASTGFDSNANVNWHVGGGNPGSNETDLRSTAAHEAGHFTGFEGHWTESGDLCGGGDQRHTMCPSIPPGEIQMRTLEDHDSHTLANAY
jgi:hypothetical protein